MTFHTDFIKQLTDDEHCLLLAVLNNNKPVHYHLQHSIAEVVMEKLTKVPVNSDGEEIKKSIVEKYTRFVDIKDQQP
jgi:hypothetical protein